jgi:hypothetical protein
MAPLAVTSLIHTDKAMPTTMMIATQKSTPVAVTVSPK